MKKKWKNIQCKSLSEEDTEALFDLIFGGHLDNNTENGDGYDQE